MSSFLSQKGQKSRPEWRRGRARIIDGQVIGPRFGKALAIAGGGVGMMVVFTCAFGWAIDFRHSMNPVMARWVGYMLAATILVLIGLGIFTFLVVRYRRLIIGKDRLQLVGSFGRLLGQVPYENIEDFRMGRVTTDSADVGINLVDRRRKDTWWPRRGGADDTYDVLIQGGFEIDGTALRLLLRDAVHEYRARHGLLR